VTEPTMKHFWAGMAMIALMLDKSYDGSPDDIAEDAWRMADAMEREEVNRDE